MSNQVINIFSNESVSSLAQETYNQLRQDLNIQNNYYYYVGRDIPRTKTYEAIKKGDMSLKKEIISICIDKIKDYYDHLNTDGRYGYGSEGYEHNRISNELLARMFRTKLDFLEADYIRLFHTYLSERKISYSSPILSTVRQLEKFQKKTALSDELQDTLKKFLDAEITMYDADKTRMLIRDILIKASGKELDQIIPVLLDEEDPFGKFINAWLQSLPTEKQKAYYNFMGIIKKTSGGRPTAKFIKSMEGVIATINSDHFHASALNILKKLKEINVEKYTKTHNYDDNGRSYTYDYYSYLGDSSKIAIKGFIWALSSFKKDDFLGPIAAYAEKCYQKIPGQGPSAAGVGNACLYTLAQYGLPGIAQLSRLKLRLRQATPKKMIENFIRQASEEFGVSPGEIQDMSVPDFELEDGQAQYEFSGYQGTVKIERIGKTTLSWINPDGKAMKSDPAPVKNNHKEELKAIKDNIKQIQKMLTAQRDRLDREMIEDRSMSYENFQNYYFKHGLMSFLCKRLIWSFKVQDTWQSAFWHQDNWVNNQQESFNISEAVSEVKLWHPIGKTTAEVLAWREFLSQNEIRQPLKQAYREIYLLTEAEVNTQTYSNRMAAHILKQHQFNSLAKLRGWQYSLLGAYDKGYDSEIAKVQLPENHRAEFWVQEVNQDDEWNDVGIYNYISTDQVRFYHNGEQMQMTAVPPLIFSETMRDVDLFVGVASVGNDPNWRDGGLTTYRDYWHTYSFGNLSELAKTRKQVLEKLIPRLKIAKKSKIDGNFLIVEGQIRTYKIHMGSGNILMEPNDQYLCIVPDRRVEKKGENVFLPFEGDSILSIIISKAFLLADDTKITDTTIISQINSR